MSSGPLPSSSPHLATTFNHQFKCTVNLHGPQQSVLSPSSSMSYRVFVGKYNLIEEETGSEAMFPEKIIVHEKWNPYFVALG